MKITVQDALVIENIEPRQLRKYLQYHAWHEYRLFVDNAIRKAQASEQVEKNVPCRYDSFEILLPNIKNVRDYLPKIR